MTNLHVLVMAKSPRPGRVKTRLCPPCSPEQAATVAAAALADTLEAVASCQTARRVVALDGPPGPWLPPGFEVIPQRGSDFNQRLANAWTDAAGPGVQIGMDTPQVTAADLDGLLTEIDEGPRRRAVLGRALDGGWWVIGWQRADPGAVFSGIPMSTANTGSSQEQRLAALGFDVALATAKRDIDTVEDLRTVAAQFPHLRTAAEARGLEDRLVLRADDGSALPLDPARWHSDPSAGEKALLAATVGPVLDVGCGPGRLVLGLARRGAVALGVDPAPAACALARDRGAPVLQRSVFDPLPGQGRWRTILLADGNIGIGGDPLRLLRRCGELLAGDGTVVVEVLGPGSGWRSHRVRLERGEQHGPWFSWATVDADAIADLANAAGLEVRQLHHVAGENRWFAHLGRAWAREHPVAVA